MQYIMHVCACGLGVEEFCAYNQMCAKNKSYLKFDELLLVQALLGRWLSTSGDAQFLKIQINLNVIMDIELLIHIFKTNAL